MPSHDSSILFVSFIINFSGHSSIICFFTELETDVGKKSKLLKQIDDMKKFNLDKKNILNSVYEILENEKQ